MSDTSTHHERITTAGILFEAGHYFIAKRKSGGSVGGLWEFPGGKHRWGETPEESLAREFFEEFNLTVHVGTCFFEHDFTNRDTRYHLLAYWVEAEDPIRYELHEHVEARWATLAEMYELPFVPSDLPVRRKLEELSLA
jgi:mutator protein MutT